MNARLALLLVNVVLAVQATRIIAEQRHVPSPSYPTIQSAIDACVDGDEVVLEPATYAGDGNRDLDFLGKAITVRSTDPNDANVVAATVIDCQGSDIIPHQGVLFFRGEESTSVVAGLVITNANAVTGGAIWCIQGSPTITRCIITGNTALFGGGLWNEDSRPSVSYCTFSGNTAVSGGAIWNTGGGAAISHCAFDENVALLGGGGAMVNFDGGDTTVTDCTFNDNTSTFGGAIYNHISNPTLTDCNFVGNVGGHGGAMYNLNCGPMLSYCTFVGNSSYWGAGIDNYDHSYPTISHCTFEQNEATWGGAMVDFGGSSSILTHCLFANNSALGAPGGGICCRSGGTTIIDDCTFVGNSAVGGSGGAIACQDGCQPTIVNTTVSGNTGDKNGGGIYLEDCGGTIRGCLIEGNTAGSWAGGIFCYLGSHPTIINCTISDNAAGEFGGGVVCFDGAAATITNCTLAGNSADVTGGGAGCSGGSSLTVRSTILWDNAAPEGAQISLPEVAGPPILSVSYSDTQGGPDAIFVDPNATLNWGEGNIEQDPCFVDPDGPDGDPNTWEDNDHHISPNSPCIDAGDPNGSPAGQTDIDGEGRKSGVVDMGSDEVWPAGVTYALDLIYDPNRGTVHVYPNLPSHPAGSAVWLTAEAISSGSWNRWKVYDPNFPGDPNRFTEDANNPIMIIMDADRQVQAVFNCSSGLLLPMMLSVLGCSAWVRRRA